MAPFNAFASVKSAKRQRLGVFAPVLSTLYAASQFMSSGALWHTAVACAKVNRFLRILQRRADGYHDLQSIFSTISLADVLHFRPRADGQLCHLRRYDFLPEEDLIIKTAKALREASGLLHLGADIILEKNIPLGAGLGGGSSDAATTLQMLNQLWELNFSQEQLHELAISLGADVPFFLSGGNAWVEGKGEKIQSISLPSLPMVLLCPPLHCATATLFAHPRLTRHTSVITIADFHQGYRENNFLPVVFDIYPEMAQLYQKISAYGQPKLSGSGSTFFLEFMQKSEAIKIAYALEQQAIGKVFLVNSAAS
jgi:4-diphosphocytidyl-2-C-methyl-D-erythritol kinase